MSNLKVSVSPHITDKTTTSSIMRDVLIALTPALIASIVIFGYRAAVVVAVCVATSVFSEWVFEKITKRPNTVKDLSAAVTGLLLAFNLPVGIPIWQAIIGSAVAVVVVKQLFGGIGKNFANPAITARIIMLVAFPQAMTTWVFPDGVSSATPLGIMSGETAQALPSVTSMLLGVRGGCLGETCAVALIIGGIYLLARKVISWHTPVAFIGTVLIFSLLLGKEPVYQLLSGGLLIGAIFMATDYSSTPNTNAGRLVFGIGCGLLTVLIRFWGNYPEGVSFSILLMNIVTPYIDKHIRKKPFGGVEA